MCEADAYLVRGCHKQMIMESVDVIEPEGENSWRLVSIFGDQKMVKGRIIGMSLVNHKVMFEAVADG